MPPDKESSLEALSSSINFAEPPEIPDQLSEEHKRYCEKGILRTLGLLKKPSELYKAMSTYWEAIRTMSLPNETKSALHQFNCQAFIYFTLQLIKTNQQNGIHKEWKQAILSFVDQVITKNQFLPPEAKTAVEELLKKWEDELHPELKPTTIAPECVQIIQEGEEAQEAVMAMPETYAELELLIHQWEIAIKKGLMSLGDLQQVATLLNEENLNPNLAGNSKLPTFKILLQAAILEKTAKLRVDYKQVTDTPEPQPTARDDSPNLADGLTNEPTDEKIIEAELAEEVAPPLQPAPKAIPNAPSVIANGLTKNSEATSSANDCNKADEEIPTLEKIETTIKKWDGDIKSIKSREDLERVRQKVGPQLEKLLAFFPIPKSTESDPYPRISNERLSLQSFHQYYSKAMEVLGSRYPRKPTLSDFVKRLKTSDTTLKPQQIQYREKIILQMSKLGRKELSDYWSVKIKEVKQMPDPEGKIELIKFIYRVYIYFVLKLTDTNLKKRLKAADYKKWRTWATRIIEQGKQPQQGLGGRSLLSEEEASEAEIILNELKPAITPIDESQFTDWFKKADQTLLTNIIKEINETATSMKEVFQIIQKHAYLTPEQIEVAATANDNKPISLITDNTVLCFKAIVHDRKKVLGNGNETNRQETN